MGNRRKPRHAQAGAPLRNANATPAAAATVTGWRPGQCQCLHPGGGGFCPGPAEYEAVWEIEECECDYECDCPDWSQEVSSYCFSCLISEVDRSHFARVTLSRITTAG